MPRLMEVADLCSRTLSDPANRLRKIRKKKSSAVPLFEAVAYRKSAPDYEARERQEFKEEGKPQVVLPFCPRGGRRDAPAVRRRRIPPLRFSEKLSARQGRTRLRQFECPAGSVQRKVLPGQSEHANAVRAPRSAGAEKAAAPFGRTACAVRVSRLTLRSYLTILREQSMLSQQQNRRKYEPVHPCTLRSVPRH